MENAQKIKLMKIYEILVQETDEEHPITRAELCRRLNEAGISSNVRTLSKDIDVLNEFGYEVFSEYRNRERVWYVLDRKFSVPEVKILIDAVQAASFVTDKKTKELVDKVASLAGSHRGELMKKNMICFNTRKHSNEYILYTVDAIEDAIIRKKMIRYSYFDLDEKARRVFRTDDNGEKKIYQVEPVALVFNEDNYYLIAYSQHHPGSTANYRIDRMAEVNIDEESSISSEALGMIKKVPNYTEQVFKMYDGELETVTLQFDRKLIGVVFDKFGERTKINPSSEDAFTAEVKIRKSSVFFGWVFQFGGRMKILSPQSVADEYDEMKRK